MNQSTALAISAPSTQSVLPTLLNTKCNDCGYAFCNHCGAALSPTSMSMIINVMGRIKLFKKQHPGLTEYLDSSTRIVEDIEGILLYSQGDTSGLLYLKPTPNKHFASQLFPSLREGYEIRQQAVWNMDADAPDLGSLYLQDGRQVLVQRGYIQDQRFTFTIFLAAGAPHIN
jgi:hypothetical protein